MLNCLGQIFTIFCPFLHLNRPRTPTEDHLSCSSWTHSPDILTRTWRGPPSPFCVDWGTSRLRQLRRPPRGATADPSVAAGPTSARGCSTTRGLNCGAPSRRSPRSPGTGVPIVGLEPSCLLTLRDESLHLLAGDARAVAQDDARAVAEHAFLVDEFLAERAGSTAAIPPQPFTTDARAAHIHGHCHQKAAGTASATGEALAALAGIPGALVESSCCGMAGSFGYTAKHLRTSRAMGELGLFPALRAAAPEDTLIANGFSCRAQIRAGTGRRARHLVEVLDGCMKG